MNFLLKQRYMRAYILANQEWSMILAAYRSEVANRQSIGWPDWVMSIVNQNIVNQR